MNAAEKLAPSHDELLSMRAAQHGWRATPLRRRLAAASGAQPTRPLPP